MMIILQYLVMSRKIIHQKYLVVEYLEKKIYLNFKLPLYVKKIKYKIMLNHYVLSIQK